MTTGLLLVVLVLHLYTLYLLQLVTRTVVDLHARLRDMQTVLTTLDRELRS